MTYSKITLYGGTPLLGAGLVSPTDTSRRNVLNHASLGVTNIGLSRRFYDAVLRPLGLVRTVDFGGGLGSDYGAGPGSFGVEFTITAEQGGVTPSPGAHLCFRAPDRPAVDAFHVAALILEAGMMGRLDSALITIPPTTPPSFSTRTVIASRWSVMRRKSQRLSKRKRMWFKNEALW